MSFNWNDLNPVNWWNSATKFTKGAVLKIIEWFIYQILYSIFAMLNTLAAVTITTVFQGFISIQDSLSPLGIFGPPIFIIIFAIVGGVIYLIFRTVEGLL
jgi:hypothetical protein